MTSQLSDDHTIRFLKILKQSQKQPSLLYLNSLIDSFIRTIPFENISKLYLKKTTQLIDIPSINKYLEGIEKFHFGGTCYANNYHFFLLLKTLGFNVNLCGADMSQPNVHCVSIVEIDNQKHLVDVGYGAPFCQAFPLNKMSDVELKYGRNKYIISKNNDNRFKLTMLRNNEIKHGYIINSISKGIDEFEYVIKESYENTSTFMNSLLITKMIKDQFIILHNYQLTISTEKKSETSNIDEKELYEVIETYFQIPARIAFIALEDVNLKGDAWN